MYGKLRRGMPWNKLRRRVTALKYKHGKGYLTKVTQPSGCKYSLGDIMAKGSIIKRGDSWRIAYDLPREPGEPRKQKFVTFRGSYKEAEAKLREILRQIDTNTYVDPGKMTLGEFLQRWLEDYCKPNLRQTTVDGYAVIIKKHLIPSLGHIKLAKLRPMHIQEYYTKAMRSGRADGKGKELSPTTVLHHHRLLHRALATAVKWQLLARNICDAVDPPRAKRYNARVYDEVAVARLLELSKGTLLYMPILLTLATGLRRGEVLALRWSDFDQERKLITVDEALLNTSTGPEFNDTKTDESRRMVTLPETIVQELEAHRERQEADRKSAGEFWVESDLICCREDGRQWHPGTFSDSFNRLLKKHELPHIRFHDLRHTHASLLLRQGIHPKVVSERLGHSRIGITMDLYSHVLPGMQDEVAKQLDEKLFKKPPN